MNLVSRLPIFELVNTCTVEAKQFLPILKITGSNSKRVLEKQENTNHDTLSKQTNTVFKHDDELIVSNLLVVVEE